MRVYNYSGRYCSLYIFTVCARAGVRSWLVDNDAGRYCIYTKSTLSTGGSSWRRTPVKQQKRTNPNKQGGVGRQQQHDDNNEVFHDNNIHDSSVLSASHVVTDAAHIYGNFIVTDPPQDVLRLRDGPPHLNKWMHEGRFAMVTTTTDKKKTVFSRTYVNSTRKNL